MLYASSLGFVASYHGFPCFFFFFSLTIHDLFPIFPFLFFSLRLFAFTFSCRFCPTVIDFRHHFIRAACLDSHKWTCIHDANILIFCKHTPRGVTGAFREINSSDSSSRRMRKCARSGCSNKFHTSVQACKEELIFFTKTTLKILHYFLTFIHSLTLIILFFPFCCF